MVDGGGLRKAGDALIRFATTPMGEEVGEGVLGGLLTGAGQLASDQSLEQTGVQTLGAIAGGIALGMAGRRVGASLGDLIHKDALKNQDGMLATAARMAGQETTGEGLGEQYRVMRKGIEEELARAASASMAREAMQDPAAFFQKHGITSEQFSRLMPAVQQGQSMAQVLTMIQELPEAERLATLRSMGVDLDEYEAVARAMGREAAASATDNLHEAAQRIREQGDMRIGGHSMADVAESLVHTAKPVTGRHVGRMLGRILGDELGVAGGLLAGKLVADAMGLQSNKDKKIADLEQQLSQGRR
jgi:hypothetical protein